MIYEEEFDQDFKDRLLDIIHKVIDEHGTIGDNDAIIYFHWAAHKDDPAYSFVPERYRNL